MSPTTFWLAILGAGAVTFVLRLSLIALLGRVEVPPLLERALRYVPAAALAAGLLAAVIAWRTRNALLVLGGGMVALWTLQAIGQVS